MTAPKRIIHLVLSTKFHWCQTYNTNRTTHTDVPAESNCKGCIARYEMHKKCIVTDFKKENK